MVERSSIVNISKCHTNIQMERQNKLKLLELTIALKNYCVEELEWNIKS